MTAPTLLRRRPAALGPAALAGALAAALALPAPPALAAEPQLTLAGAVETALGAYPSVAAARSRLAEAGETVAEARATQGPLVRATLSGLQYDDPMLTSPIHSFTPAGIPPFDETLFQGSLNVSWTFFDSGARRERTRAATEQQAAAAAALGATEQALAARVATAFGQALARREILAAEEARIVALGLELERAALMFTAGKSPEVERLRAEAALAGAEADRTRAATALDSAERDLARLLGADVEETRAAGLAPLVSPATPPPARPVLHDRAVAASPAVEAARRSAAAADAARALARTAYFPELRLVGALQEFAAAGVDPVADWNAGVQVSIPLWDGGMTGSRVARAAAATDTAKSALAQAELDAREAVDRALAALAESEARAAALERAAARLAEVARIQKLLLEVGSGTQTDYLAAESELAATRARFAEAETSARLARVELARATGELSPEWLRRNLETAR